MATVTSKTSIKIDDLVNDTIVDGEVVSGHLILRTRGGAEIDAGVIAATSPLDFMPVGYVFTSVDPTSPQTMFGGTWVRIGQGRVLVGQDPTQTEFDTVGETGGEKTHALSTGEMPNHSHTINTTTQHSILGRVATTPMSLRERLQQALAPASLEVVQQLRQMERQQPMAVTPIRPMCQLTQ